MKEGLSSEEYLNKLDKTKWADMLKVAMEVRQFEISLYWKRANYFWLFVSLCFIAYYHTAYQASYSWTSVVENLLSAVGGYILSLGWFFANRGSKYWQENWEQHIAVLSKQLGIPVFELLKSNHSDVSKLVTSYPYSLSRVNQIINIAVIAVWVILLGMRTYQLFGDCCHKAIALIVLCVFLYATTRIIHHYAMSFVVRECTDHSKTFFSNIETD